MERILFTRSFLIGLLASSSFGPIFILTFNRGAIYGFWRGFLTAVGACIADGLYFFLGLLGILTVLKDSKNFLFLLDFLGGILLIILGILSIKKAFKAINSSFGFDRLGLYLTVVKSFLLTFFNPMVLFFFMVIGVQIFPAEIEFLSYKQIFLCSIMVMLGSLSVLTLVSLVASYLGSSISQKKLKLISFFTGIVFLCIGAYFLYNSVKIFIFRFNF